MNPAVTILRAADRTATPWLNGGGSTSEIAIYPPDAGMTAFDWRLSIANVTQPGPFSRFENIDRTIGILSGRLELRFPDGVTHTLSAPCDTLKFAGDTPCFGVPADGPVTDINLMTRRGVATGRIARFGDGEISLQSLRTWAVAASPSQLAWLGGVYSLAPGDAVQWIGTAPEPARFSGQGYLAEITG